MQAFLWPLLARITQYEVRERDDAISAPPPPKTEGAGAAVGWAKTPNPWQDVRARSCTHMNKLIVIVVIIVMGEATVAIMITQSVAVQHLRKVK